MKKELVVTLEKDIDVEKNLLELIEELQSYYEHYGRQYTRLRLDTEEYNRPYDDETYRRVNLLGHRLETDEEYNQRVAKDQEVKDQQRQRDLEMLDILKKRLGM